MSTIRELLLGDERSLLQLEPVTAVYDEFLTTVLVAGEKKLLVPRKEMLNPVIKIFKKFIPSLNEVCANVLYPP